MGKKPYNLRPVRVVGEQGPPKAHRLEGKVENRGLKAVKKKPRHAK